VPGSCHSILFSYLDCQVWLESSQHLSLSRDDHDSLPIPSFGVCCVSHPPRCLFLYFPPSRWLFLPPSGVCLCSSLSPVSVPIPSLSPWVYFFLTLPFGICFSLPLLSASVSVFGLCSLCLVLSAYSWLYSASIPVSLPPSLGVYHSPIFFTLGV
jgi:hypothetical protein